MHHNKLLKILHEMGVEENLTCKISSCKNCIQLKKHQLEPGMEQQTGSKLGKENIKAVYCHLLI